MRRFLVLLLSAVSLGLSPYGRAAENSGEAEIHQLANVRCFAFGPSGKNQLLSTGESSFREVCTKEFAEAYFVELFQRGSAEGKCYALVGLRELSSEFFAKYSDAFKKTAPRYVTVNFGHFLGQAKTSEVLAKITAGHFSQYFKSKSA